MANKGIEMDFEKSFLLKTTHRSLYVKSDLHSSDPGGK
jgi:hypothetical protein